MQSTVINWDSLAAKPTPAGFFRNFFNAPTATLENFEGHATTLNPGLAPHAAHRHADEELIIVREGTLEVRINGQSQAAGPGAILFFASNDLHGLHNAGSTPAIYYVFRFIAPPKPAAT